MTKLIILRGNSGSGKSTVAKALANKAERKLALIDADMYRVEMLFPKPFDPQDHGALMKQNVLYCLEHGYDVVWDSIFYAHDRNKEYLGEFFQKLHPNDNYIFNFDISLEEVVRRHSTRDKSKLFGPDHVKEWYQPVEKLGYDFEYTIPESNTIEDTLNQISKTTGL